MSAPRRSSPSLDLSVLGGLFVAEGAAAMALLGLYKGSTRPLGEFVRSPAGMVTVGSVLVLAVAIAVVVYRFRRSTPETRIGVRAAAILNLVTVAVVLVACELAVRVLAVETPTGQAIAGTQLLPKQWRDLAQRNRAVLARAESTGSYLVFDERLGWTVGKNRRGKDPYRRFHSEAVQQRRARDIDIYLSSTEGIRSATAGISFAERRPAHRVALVGDSFTFGLEVVYEDTWGARLESALANDTQVLNFGVDGYGVDQALLRYQRDVLPWHPEIVVFGVIEDDLRRTFCVYAFLCFQAFGEIPFPKPRFEVDTGGLRQLNAPLPRPESVFTRSSIAELPFIDYDESYVADEWRWRFVHHSYLVRFIVSRFPRWPQPSPNHDPERRASVNGRLLKEFIRLATEQGSVAVIVVFPGSSSPLDSGALARRFAGVDVPFKDMSSCVARVPPGERFVFRHYTPAANAAIADCLVDSLRQIQRTHRPITDGHEQP